MLTDFATWPTSVTVDPATAYVRAGTGTINSGAIGSAWTRPWVSFVPGRTTKFVGIGVKTTPTLVTTGTAQNGAQHFTKWMVEKTKVGTGTAVGAAPSSLYSPARQLRVKVRADRVNHILDPTFGNTGAAQWSYTNAVRITTGGVANGPAAQITATAAGNGGAYIYQLSPITVVPGRTYTFSAFAQRTVGTPNLRMIFESAVGTVMTGTNADVTHTLTSSLVRYSQSATIASGVTTIYPYLAVAANAAGDRIVVDQIQFEEGDRATDYFDGSLSTDTMWETGGTAHASRSYYYLNKGERTVALNRALEDAAALGTPIAAPEFGVFMP